jgi:hypothetical protein
MSIEGSVLVLSHGASVLQKSVAAFIMLSCSMWADIGQLHRMVSSKEESLHLGKGDNGTDNERLATRR